MLCLVSPGDLKVAKGFLECVGIQMERSRACKIMKATGRVCSIGNAMLCYAKSLQSCPTLCDPIDGSPPGSVIPGILQARILEWGAIAFSSA